MMLDGQVPLVPGASRGIGRAVAIALARNGAHVIINYHRNREAAERTQAEITAAGGHGEIAQFDVADENQIEQAVKRIVDLCSKIDILVNNAGVTSDALLVRMK